MAEIGRLKIKSIMRDRFITQQIIAFDQFSHGGNKRFSFVIIEDSNVRCDFTYHIVHFHVRFHSRQYWLSKTLASLDIWTL